MTTIDVNIRTEELGKSITNATEAAINELQRAVGALSESTHGEIVRLANDRLKTTRLDYISALEFEKVDDNIYIITLRGDHANHIEDGWSAYDQKEGLLSGPKAKISKKGVRYNTIPFRHQPYAKAPASARMTNLRDALKTLLKENKIDKILKDPSGVPKQGIVARIQNTGIRDLEGLVKIQKTYEKTTQSLYMTFRRVSDNSSPDSWKHPGYGGARIFDDVSRFVEQQIDEIIKKLL